MSYVSWLEEEKGFLTNIVCLSIIFLSMNCCSSHVSHIFCLHVYIFERDNCTPTQLDYNIIIPMHTSINLKSTTGQAKYFYCIIIGIDIWPFPIFYNALYFIKVALYVESLARSHCISSNQCHSKSDGIMFLSNWTPS